jgi:hypothetical protein
MTIQKIMQILPYTNFLKFLITRINYFCKQLCTISKQVGNVSKK